MDLWTHWFFCDFDSLHFKWTVRQHVFDISHDISTSHEEAHQNTLSSSCCSATPPLSHFKTHQSKGFPSTALAKQKPQWDLGSPRFNSAQTSVTGHQPVNYVELLFHNLSVLLWFLLCESDTSDYTSVQRPTDPTHASLLHQFSSINLNYPFSFNIT